MVASESVAIEGTGHTLTRDVAPGEAIFIDLEGIVHARQCADNPSLNPCMFEYVYLARPDSVMDGISVYQARLNLGETLAQRLISTMPPNEIDVVIPIPESSRPSAMQLAQRIGKPYREGFVKNRYVGRTFIMPGQGVRKKSVRQKLNAIGVEFKGRNVLLVDDSIVRGTTSKEIVQMARDAGARKVYLASAAPPVRFPNVYGIDMPTSDELIAHDRSIEEIRAVHRRRCADLPGRGGDEARRRRAQPGARRLRGLVLRRRLHHRRRQRRRVRRDGRAAQRRRATRKRATDRSRLALQSATETSLMTDADGDGRSRASQLPADARLRHARGARGPAAQRLGRELRGAVPDQQLRPARCRHRGGALRQRGRGVHLLALHQPDGDDVRAPPGRARRHRGLHRHLRAA